MKAPWQRPLTEGDIAILAMVAFVVAGFIFYYTVI